MHHEGVGSEYRIGEGNSVTAAYHPLLHQQAATQYYTVKTYTVKSTKMAAYRNNTIYKIKV